ncbi:helix-turn-helix domain-containing protein [Mameliella sp. CS4]|uniref:helix-turn-helix domain-containing protein n=1 Tax=Mameliella sp. CS4 TaxID=2862329 RepID=UPI001C6017DE|nr:helix-turn-helix transcriptional regulator [Mameliella sp. CS4]MBW4985875.1 helix-turn-helix domain-containing protein [Mameliella sp. CS4]
MKLMFNQEWLNLRIKDDAGEACEVGAPIHRAADFTAAIHAAREETDKADKPAHRKGVLGLLVLQVRRRDKLTVAELAQRLRVDPAELEALETNPDYGPQPRTLHQLSGYTEIPATNLMRLTPDAHNVNGDLESAAMKFAASSDDVSDLSRTERRGLNDFVKFLVKYKDGPDVR